MNTIFVDADACKKYIREYLIRFILRASNNTIKLVIVSNKKIPNIPNNFARFHYIQVPQTPEAADNYIISCATKGDLVLTRDLLLAQKLIEKDITVVSEFAETYHKDTIIARKQRAIQNAEYRTFMRSSQQPKHTKASKHTSKEKQEVAKFAHYLNTWKQSM